MLKELISKAKKKQKKGYAKKTGKSYNKQELNVFFKKKLKKALKVGKEASRMQELRNFEELKLSESEKSSSDSSSISSSSSESSWKIGSDETFIRISSNKHGRKSIKCYSETFPDFDSCLNENFNYESLRSRLASHQKNIKNK